MTVGKAAHGGAPAASPRVIYTVGHSTLPIEGFLELLRLFGIERLVDVRTIPRSRHNPQFNKDMLSPFLRLRRITYLHLKELGGLRRPNRDDPTNAGWHNASFRGFADYMQTPAFASALKRLILLAKGRTTAIMCAESVPWRCHRSLIADALTVRGVRVVDIITRTNAKEHLLHPMAEVSGWQVTYPEKGVADR